MIPRALFVRLSTIVSRIPSIRSFGLILRFTFETECSRRFRPFVDRKLGCEGMITLSAAAKALIVIIPNDGIAVCASLRGEGIKSVVDSNEAHAQERENAFQIVAGFLVVSAEAG